MVANVQKIFGLRKAYFKFAKDFVLSFFFSIFAESKIKQTNLYMSQELKRGRTATQTIQDLMQSKRFELAVEFIKEDPMMMQAILTELCMESARVQKTALVKCYSAYHTMDVKQLKPLLKDCDAGASWNIYWGLTTVEQMLYSIDPKCQKSTHDRFILLDQLKKDYEPVIGAEPELEEIEAD